MKKGFYYQTSEAGFCSLFNNLFYSYIYAKNKKIPFFILDKPNPIGLNYPIFKTILSPQVHLKYINSPEKGLIKLGRNEIIIFLSTLSNDYLRKEAKEFFKWSDFCLENINLMKKEIKRDTFDIGIHIRAGDKITTGEMKEISIESYIQKTASIINIPIPNIFIMSDSLQKIEEFKRLAPKNWVLHYFQTNILDTHFQDNFNKKSFDNKLNALFQFMAELECMKQSKKIVCTFSSNVSRFLFLVHSDCEYHSLDLKIFSSF